MKRALLLILAIAATLSSFAYDFSAKNAEGVTIYYKRLDAATVEVTWGDAKYSGYVAVPTKVSDGTTDYSVVGVGDRAFDSCYELTGASLPEGVTYIGIEGFDDCESLTEISLPNTLENIGLYGLYATDIMELTIPASVKYIDYYAFCECYSLERLVCHADPDGWGMGLFSYCPALQSIEGEYATDDGRCLVSGNTLYAFAPAGLTTYTFPETVEIIPAETCEGGCQYDDEQGKYVGIQVLSLPAVKEVGFEAFNDAFTLQSVTIGPDIEYIDQDVFLASSELRTIIMHSQDPTAIDASKYLVDPAIYETCLLRVPAGTMSLYSVTEPWLNFMNVEEFYEVQDIVFRDHEVRIPIGGEHLLGVTILPETIPQYMLEWGSDDLSIATVNQDGLIKGLAEGTTMVYAYIDDVYDQCVVTVYDESALSVIDTDSAEAAYYTLDGLQVGRPVAPGIYIVRQGPTVSKLLVR